MARIHKFLEIAVSTKASDLHFSSAEPIRMRLHGDLVFADGEQVRSHDELVEILFEILTPEEQEKFWAHRNLDKSYMAEGIGNFRVNIFLTRRGIAAVLRTIPTKIPTIEQLGLPDVVKALTEVGKGLVLVTGPTGSGKSTTLAAMINHINENNPYHILTCEDPVEFVHPCKQSLVNQREIGTSCLTFSDALKYALREDPDVILVGEMRDLETIGLALTASETGHLVFGTLHTRGAAASVDRIIDSFPSNQQAMIRTMISESLVAVISQALLKRADNGGRIAAYEIMVVNHAISNLIREGKTFQINSIMQTGRKEGMVLMDQYIKDLVAKKIVSPEEGAIYVSDPSVLGMAPKEKGLPGAGASGHGAAAPAAKPQPQTPPQAAPARPASTPPRPAPVAAAAPPPPPAPAAEVEPEPEPAVEEVAFEEEAPVAEAAAVVPPVRAVPVKAAPAVRPAPAAPAAAPRPAPVPAKPASSPAKPPAAPATPVAKPVAPTSRPIPQVPVGVKPSPPARPPAPPRPAAAPRPVPPPASASEEEVFDEIPAAAEPQMGAFNGASGAPEFTAPASPPKVPSAAPRPVAPPPPRSPAGAPKASVPKPPIPRPVPAQVPSAEAEDPGSADSSILVNGGDEDILGLSITDEAFNTQFIDRDQLAEPTKPANPPPPPTGKKPTPPFKKTG